MRQVILKSLLIALSVVLVAGSSWLLATKFQSSAQVAARAEPPAAIPVTSKLTSGYLQSPVSVSVTATSDQSFKLPNTGINGVVTAAIIEPGDEVGAGEVLLRVNNRPLFLLPGEFPYFRDLTGGDTGDDVKQLQEGLRSAGISTGRDKTGTFGEGTKKALTRMYERAKYVVPDNDSEVRPQLDDVNRELVINPGDQSALRNKSVLLEKLGPRLLRSEVTIAAQLPATAMYVAPTGSSTADLDQMAELATGSTHLTASVPSSSVQSLKVGAAGSFVDANGQQVRADVTSIEPDSSTPGNDVLTFDPLESLELGSIYTVTIDNPSLEDGESILTPLAAVINRSNGSSVYLQRDGSFVEVAVAVLGTNGGVAAIAATSAGIPLTTGMVVRVG